MLKENKNVTQEKRSAGSLRQLLPYVLPHWGKLAVMMACMVVSNIAALYIPGQIGVVIDMIAVQSAGVGQLVLFMICAAVIAWVLTALQNVLAVSVGQSVISALRHDLFAHMAHLPVSYYDGMSKGNLMSIMVTDTSNLSETISTDLVTLVTGCVTIIGASIMMLRISPLMTLIFMVTVPMMWIVTYFISKNARRLHHQRKAAYGKMCGYSEEMLTAQKSVFVYGQEEGSYARFAALSGDQRTKGTKAEFCSSLMMPAMNAITNLNYTLVAASGAFLALTGVVSIGNISSFALYSKKFGGPISDASNIIGMLQSSLAACDRIFAVLNAPIEETSGGAERSAAIAAVQDCAQTNADSEVQNSGRMATEDTALQASAAEGTACSGKIEFSHVAFAYDPAKPILRDVDFTIQPGQKIAVVGSTGAGKTTLISLLLRFYAVTGGEIKIDDIPIETLPLGALRRRFAMVLQDVWLFDGTVYENITYAMPEHDRSREKVRALCREIGVEEMIEQLPGGYDCYLRNDSTALSQGQKQLLSIARAFLCEPNIFILDEATSSIDPQTEHSIQAVTNRVLQGKTSIVIAHRLSTILSADCILVLRDGYLVEQGTHTQLLAQGGIYRQIFESQFVS
ncbi:MAG: ABC transporter ATP-binding protein [Faecalibacterium sp.]